VSDRTFWHDSGMDLTKTPPIVQYLITAVTTATALFVTQGLVDNRTEKLVTGLASILIPLGYLLLVSVLHAKDGRITSARITAGLPTVPPGSSSG